LPFSKLKPKGNKLTSFIHKYWRFSKRAYSFPDTR